MPDAIVTKDAEKPGVGRLVRLNVTLPIDLHRAAKSKAAQEGMTILAFVQTAVRQYLDAA